MSTAQNQRPVGFFHPAIISAMPRPASMSPPAVFSSTNSPVHLIALLHHGQQRKNMFILGSLAEGGQHLVALDLPYNRQCVNGSPGRTNPGRAQLSISRRCFSACLSSILPLPSRSVCADSTFFTHQYFLYYLPFSFSSLFFEFFILKQKAVIFLNQAIFLTVPHSILIYIILIDNCIYK